MVMPGGIKLLLLIVYWPGLYPRKLECRNWRYQRIIAKSASRCYNDKVK